MFKYITEEVRRLAGRGANEVRIVQNRRFVGDAVSVDGKWYAVKLDINAVDDVVVYSGMVAQPKYEAIDVDWMDENGRAIVDAKG